MPLRPAFPSRTALLTGIPPYRSGVYSNYQYWREVMPEAVTLPRYFMANGYYAAGAGKIFHNDQPDPDSWDEYFPSKEQHMPTLPLSVQGRDREHAGFRGHVR